VRNQIVGQCVRPSVFLTLRPWLIAPAIALMGCSGNDGSSRTAAEGYDPSERIAVVVDGSVLVYGS